MSIVWPFSDGLGAMPQSVEVSEAPDVLTQAVDVGAPKTRLLRRVADKIVKVRVLMNGERLEQFMDWWRLSTRCGMFEFEWVDAVGDGSATYRFETAPQYSLVRGGPTSAARVWEVTFTARMLGA
jgi:hypothetical protein